MKHQDSVGVVLLQFPKHLWLLQLFYILPQDPTFFAFSKFKFCDGTKSFERPLDTIQFLPPAQKKLESVEGQGTNNNFNK